MRKQGHTWLNVGWGGGHRLCPPCHSGLGFETHSVDEVWCWTTLQPSCQVMSLGSAEYRGNLLMQAPSPPKHRRSAIGTALLSAGPTKPLSPEFGVTKCCERQIRARLGVFRPPLVPSPLGHPVGGGRGRGAGHVTPPLLACLPSGLPLQRYLSPKTTTPPRGPSWGLKPKPPYATCRIINPPPPSPNDVHGP